MVNGIVDIVFKDVFKNSFVSDTLTQGDLIGQYSVLSSERVYFDVVAKSPVRVLSLSEQFFATMIDDNKIKGLEDSVNHA